MRSKAVRRTLLIALAATLVPGLAGGTAQAANAKKIVSHVEIEWYVGGGDPFSLIGDVHAKTSKCERRRKVTLEVGGQVVGTDTTDRTGDWSIPTDLDFKEPFVASVAKKAIGSGDKKLVCKAADSPEFVIEA
jgi:hypothetical protein